jgi:hypothetical protein
MSKLHLQRWELLLGPMSIQRLEERSLVTVRYLPDLSLALVVIKEGAREYFNESKLGQGLEYLFNEVKKREQKGAKNG